MKVTEPTKKRLRKDLLFDVWNWDRAKLVGYAMKSRELELERMNRARLLSEYKKTYPEIKQSA